MTDAFRESCKANRTSLASNAALMLSTQLQTTGDKGVGQLQIYGLATQALGRAHIIYEKAYERWKSTTAGESFLARDFEVSGRMAIGLGTASVLENGLTLHHIYGTPIIPGSALKGLTAYYCDNVLGKSNNEFLHTYDELDEHGVVNKHVRGKYYQMLFVTNDNAGLISFHDAWITPDWVRDGKCLLLDVITTHHPRYYSASPIQPTDTEDPIPIHFLSIRGKFHIVLEVEEDSADANSWRDFTMETVKAALSELGIGGKTSSGYGRMAQ